MRHKCLNCNKDIEMDAKSKRVRCIYCGFRILSKDTPVSPRRVRAK